MEFQVIYSRKIEGSVSAFTGVIFAFQYGLTRETVAENFSNLSSTNARSRLGVLEERTKRYKNMEGNRC